MLDFGHFKVYVKAPNVNLSLYFQVPRSVHVHRLLQFMIVPTRIDGRISRIIYFGNYGD